MELEDQSGKFFQLLCHIKWTQDGFGCFVMDVPFLFRLPQIGSDESDSQDFITFLYI